MADVKGQYLCFGHGPIPVPAQHLCMMATALSEWKGPGEGEAPSLAQMSWASRWAGPSRVGQERGDKNSSSFCGQ